LGIGAIADDLGMDKEDKLGALTRTGFSRKQITDDGELIERRNAAAATELAVTYACEAREEHGLSVCPLATEIDSYFES